MVFYHVNIKFLREFTDYLLGQANNTLDFDCIPHISNTLPVTMTDMDGIVVIPLFNMRTGIDPDTIIDIITIHISKIYNISNSRSS